MISCFCGSLNTFHLHVSMNDLLCFNKGARCSRLFLLLFWLPCLPKVSLFNDTLEVFFCEGKSDVAGGRFGTCFFAGNIQISVCALMNLISSLLAFFCKEICYSRPQSCLR